MTRVRRTQTVIQGFSGLSQALAGSAEPVAPIPGKATIEELEAWFAMPLTVSDAFKAHIQPRDQEGEPN